MITQARHWHWRILIAAAMQIQRLPTTLMLQYYHHIRHFLNKAHFKSIFGLTFMEFDDIHHALQLPEPVQMPLETAMLMLLAWLRGSRLQSLEGQFGWSYSRISHIVHHMSTYIHGRWCHLLNITSPCHQLVVPWHLDYYAVVIKRHTCMPNF